MKKQFPREWRTQSLAKRRFYAKYMTWLEQLGFAVVALVFGAFIFAFFYQIDDVVSAERVEIKPESTSVMAEDKTLVVAVLAEPFTEVEGNTPLVEVVEGQDNIFKYESWKKAEELVEANPDNPRLRAIAFQFLKPPTKVVQAPVAGTFRLMSEGVVDSGEELARIEDYSQIVVDATFTGDTVAKAREGQSVALSSVSLQESERQILRAETSNGSLISRKLLNDSLNESVADQLQGYSVKLTDDEPLQVTGVESIEVDARLDWSGGVDGETLQLDPPREFTLTARVESGTPMATVQTSDLPPDVRLSIESALKEQVSSTSVRSMEGETGRLSNPRNVQTVLKLTANGRAGSGTKRLPATKLDRSFEARLRVQDPPEFLIQALKDAAKTGDKVVANAELKTGQRPIAFILLKRS